MLGAHNKWFGFWATGPCSQVKEQAWVGEAGIGKSTSTIFLLRWGGSFWVAIEELSLDYHIMEI